MMPLGRLVVVTVRPDEMVMERLPEFAVRPPLSWTVTVKVAVPDAVGVPLMAPLELNVRPAGKAPVASVQVYGAVPPVAASVAPTYGVFKTPFGRELVVTVSGAVIVMLRVLLAV